MAEKSKEEPKKSIGYGSSSQKGNGKGSGTGHEIKAVPGDQVWTAKPDKNAPANPCIWQQSGVVKLKNCNNFYDCTTCKYDLGMEKRVQTGKAISWRDAMRKRGELDRICRHSLTNRIARRACAYDYECSKCDFDQFFEDVWTAKTGSMPREVQDVKGFQVPMDYYFHKGHTWARIENGGSIRIGMDDFALRLLGKADAFDLPLMGKELERDSAGWGLRRKENLADVLSPMDGIIMEVNSRIRENPALANREPYQDGWLFMVQTPDIKKTVKTLMADTDSVDWMSGEVNRLENMIKDVDGNLDADDGHFTEDIFGNLPDLGWKNLTRTFLKT